MTNDELRRDGDRPDPGDGGVAAVGAVALATDLAANVLGASVALQGSAVAAILGAAAVPVVQRAATAVVERRAASFGERLRRRGVSAEDVLRAVTEDPRAYDLFRTALAAATDTEHEAKRALLADVLASGILTADGAAAAYARRVIHTVSRIDALEILLLDAVEDAAEQAIGGSGGRGGVSMVSIRSIMDGARQDMLDAGMAVLLAEGLLAVADASGTGWRVSDYGRRVLREIRLIDEEG
ncbi:hypothetical protein [Micromonospora sp. WMMB235]|uniref:hypothetical protein n=1 Tax=Micromonospora sp. WMMB235 TaxID=1172030 RepID=UPI0008DAD32B|nr:hypothetical protein [Micromonospora sp. WMMB235]OHX03942.1 hypothetical protein BFV98_13570 [Micromonospora sp. WMMB235]